MADYALPSVVEKRVRYFDGQFLQDQDFIDEQSYQLDREHRHNRLLHGPGIADGLTVTSAAPNQLTVAPGTAVDSDGYQLVLAQATPVDLAADFNDKQGIELYISYLQSAEDPQTVGGSGDFTRWLERPQLTALAPGQAWSGSAPPVLLAKLALDASGRVAVDNTVRSYSGLRLPGPGDDAPALRSAASGQAGLDSSLTIDGDLTFAAAPATISGAGRLHITGEELLYLLNKSGVVIGKEWGGTGGLTVEGDLQAGGSASVQDNLVVSGNVGLGTTASSARLSVNGDMTLAAAPATISGAGRLHITGEEVLYLLNKSGVVIGKEWGGTGALTVEGDLQAGGSASVQHDLLVTGRVGIGTATPQAALQVSGGKAQFDGQQQIIFTDADTTNNLKLQLWSRYGLGINPGALFYAADGLHSWRDASGINERMALTTGADGGLTVRGTGASTFAGNVGIGNPSPAYPLHLAVGKALRIDGGSSSPDSAAYFSFGGNGAFSIDAPGVPSGRFVVQDSGNVGIGTTNPSALLTVNGDLTFAAAPATITGAGRLHITGEEVLYLLNKSGVVVGTEWGGNGNLYVEGTFSQASDARLKKRIQRLESTLDKLAEIRGVSYLPRNAGGVAGQSGGKPAIGVIAQEVEAVYPELVSTIEGNPYKGVHYGGLTAVLLEAVKELKAALDPLLERVGALEAHA